MQSSSRFDEVLDRRGTDSVKWDFPDRFNKPATALPMWVADMDFRAPQEVLDALSERVANGVFGYTDTGDDYFEAVAGWMRRRHGWRVEPGWLIKSPGVVVALNLAVRAMTKPGDSILVQPPVYPPIHSVPKTCDRKLVTSELQLEDGRYEVDFDDFERKIVDEQVKLFILCNPHNPIGRSWSREELERIGEICLRHDVRVISDEIHQDLVLPGCEHVVFAGLAPELEAITVTCTAPSKTFNLAGLQTANLFASDDSIRRAISHEFHGVGIHGLNTLGLTACAAAYRHGETWLDELLTYLEGNVQLVREFLAARLPQVRLVEPDATYLLWLDFRDLGLEDKELDRRLTEDCRLWLNDGPSFGDGGSGFMRMNIACPRSTLIVALQSMELGLA